MTIRPPPSQKWPIVPAQGFGVAQAARSVGIDPAPFFPAVGLDPALLDQRTPSLAEEDLPNFVSALRSLTAELEAEAARQAGTGTPHPYQYDLMWFAAAGCKLLNNIIGMIPVFSDILGSRMGGISSGARDNMLEIAFAERAGEALPVVFLADFLRLIAFDRMLSWFSGEYISGICFEFSEPKDFAPYIPVGLTQRAIRWSAPRTRLVLPSASGALPVVRGPAEFEEIFPITPLLLGERPASPYAMGTARLIDDAIAEARTIPDLVDVAREMKCSVATIRRRLADEGTSLQTLKNERRHAWAVNMLQEGLSIADIADALCFSDEATFRRAFKQWAGAPPSRFKISAPL